MFSEVVEEMRAAVTRSGFTQREIADALSCSEVALSRYLNEKVSLPEGFSDRFRATLRRLAEEKAAALRAEAERKAQQLLAAVPAEEEQVAA